MDGDLPGRSFPTKSIRDDVTTGIDMQADEDETVLFVMQNAAS